jgi:hypothetical protein
MVGSIESSQMKFGLVPKVFDIGNVISAGGEDLGMIIVHNIKLCDVECIVCPETVGENNAARSHSLQWSGSMFRYYARHNARKNLSVPFKQNENRHFADSSSASSPFSESTEITLNSIYLSIPFEIGKLRGCDKYSALCR